MISIDPIYLNIFLGITSALILFLYAIDSLSNEFQILAAEKFRNLIGELAKFRIVGLITGAISTAVIQSSSAVSVIAVILVNTGVISFSESLSIIFGTNIGTTITAQLVLINSQAIAPILIIVGTILRFAGRRFKLIGKPIFFLGFILFTLNLLSSAIAPLSDNLMVKEILSDLSNPIFAYLVSALLTLIIHSSSVTSGIVVILSLEGLIPVEVAIPMILGANVGSSFTAFIASFRLSLHAKRAGVANLLFNLIGTFIFMLLLPQFISVLGYLVEEVANQAALAHFLFNVINSILFLILLSPFESLVKKIVRGEEEEVLFKPKYLNSGKSTPEVKLQNIRRELVYSIQNTIKIYQEAISIYYNPSKQTKMKIQKLETLNDYLDEEITKAIVDVAKKRLSIVDAHSSVLLVKISNTIEQIGDLGKDLSNVFNRMHDLGYKDKDVCIDELNSLHSEYLELLKYVVPLILEPSEEKIKEIRKMEIELVSHIQEQFDIHVNKLQQEGDYNGNVFVDAVSIIELATSKVRTIRKLMEV